MIHIYGTIKHIIPHFLKKMGSSDYWITPDEFIWIIPGGQGWGTGSPSRHLAWILALLNPLQDLFNRFHAVAQGTLYILNITGQVIYLEHYLNDQFDNSLRRIYIEDATVVLPPYLYNLDDDEDHLHLFNKADAEDPLYLYNQRDYSTRAEFIVYVPSAIPLTTQILNQIRAAVNRFKQAGVYYTIESY